MVQKCEKSWNFGTAMHIGNLLLKKEHLCTISFLKCMFFFWMGRGLALAALPHYVCLSVLNRRLMVPVVLWVGTISSKSLLQFPQPDLSSTKLINKQDLKKLSRGKILSTLVDCFMKTCYLKTPMNLWPHPECNYLFKFSYLLAGNFFPVPVRTMS